MLLRYNVNTCDQIASEIMVHFTSFCENKCSFCIDAFNNGVKSHRPDVESIFNSIDSIKEQITDVTISGGEPCLFMIELYSLIKLIKDRTNLKVGLITSMPTTCWTKKELFFQILSMVDYYAISPQHYDESIADIIRGSKSKYNHQELYKILPYKEKCCVNINLIKHYLDDIETICSCVKHYNDLGFETIKVAEIFEKPHLYVSFEDIFKIKLKSPFSCGCKTIFDITPWIPTFKGKFILKRTCFMVNKKNHASFSDLLKIVTRNLFSKDYSFGVIYENGEIRPYWS